MIKAKNLIRPRARRRGIMVVTVFVAVMSDMQTMTLCLFQRIANAHRRRIGGVQ